MSGEARSAILGRVASALGKRDVAPPEGIAAEWASLPRDYAQRAAATRAAILDLLEERLRDYDAEVTRVAEREVAGVLSALLLARGDLPMLVPQGFPDAWRPQGVSLTTDDGLPIRQLDGFEGVLTGATVAIAETGTLVLQNVPGQGRRAATLVPDFHLCVVRARDVVENVPEAFARLAATAMLPTTFVSGPSATADIEMTRIKGVHGPRFLHVVLVLDEL